MTVARPGAQVIALLVRGLLFAALPVAVYFALRHFQPREVALVLIALLLLRSPGRAAAFLRQLGWHAVFAATAAIILATLIWRSNDPSWVLLYPVAISGLMLVLFATSLVRPPSLVERLARLRQPNLPREGVAYCHRVTLVWCGFFVVNGTIAAWTVFAASREVWVLYNGLVSYLLMGTLFAGEWLYRRWRFGTEAVR